MNPLFSSFVLATVLGFIEEATSSVLPASVDTSQSTPAAAVALAVVVAGVVFARSEHARKAACGAYRALRVKEERAELLISNAAEVMLIVDADTIRMVSGEFGLR